MKDIMIATGNPNKVREYREMLEPLGYKVHDLSEIEHIEVEETGDTFEANALIKAFSVNRSVNMMTIADDSGLEITCLNNEPGIHSARYLAGHDYAYKNRVLIERVRGAADRSARFVCAIALVEGEKKARTFVGVMEGEIAEEPRGNNGFGYDPIFLVPQYGMTSAQLTPEQKNSISHRGQATRALLAYLNEKNEETA